MRRCRHEASEANWSYRRMQDVVRLTFKAFHDALRVQAEAIRSLETALESKAESEDVWMAVQDKASSAEVHSRLAEMRSILSSKPDRNEVGILSSSCIITTRKM